MVEELPLVDADDESLENKLVNKELYEQIKAHVESRCKKQTFIIWGFIQMFKMPYFFSEIFCDFDRGER